jgi:hypothetical protein
MNATLPKEKQEDMKSFKGLFKNKSNKASSCKKECMLSFPGSSAIMGFEDDFDVSVSTKATQRNSICLNNIDLAGLSVYDSDNDTANKQPPKRSSSNVSNISDSFTVSGGAEHRPLVGGFAAAAYEAARVDYYRKKGMKVNGHDNFTSGSKQKLRLGRSDNLPRYP